MNKKQQDHEFILAVDGIFRGLRDSSPRYQNYRNLDGSLVSFFSVFTGSENQVNIVINQEACGISFTK